LPVEVLVVTVMVLEAVLVDFVLLLLQQAVEVL
jgi:hypothetical protein